MDDIKKTKMDSKVKEDITEKKCEGCEDCKCENSKNVEAFDGIKEVKELNLEIEELKKALELEKNAKLRFMADCENLKARFSKEREDLIAFSQNALLLKILDIVDDLGNLLRSHEENGNAENSWIDGLKMIYQKLLTLIEMEGVEVIKINKGDKFDHDTSEAVGFTNVSNDDEVNKIAQVVSMGYLNKKLGKVIKTGKVIVTKIENK